MQNSGLDNMLNMDQTENLSRLYRLFSKVPEGISTLKRALKDSILRRGASLAQPTDMDDDGNGEGQADVAADVKGKGKGKARVIPNGPSVASKWVEGVLALKDKFDEVWKKSFSSDREIGTSCNEVSCTIKQKEIGIETCGIPGFREHHKQESPSSRIYIIIHRRKSQERS